MSIKMGRSMEGRWIWLRKCRWDVDGDVESDGDGEGKWRWKGYRDGEK
jgi:hypothetical protein